MYSPVELFNNLAEATSLPAITTPFASYPRLDNCESAPAIVSNAWLPIAGGVYSGSNAVAFASSTCSCVVQQIIFQRQLHAVSQPGCRASSSFRGWCRKLCRLIFR